ncbi:MAG: DUF6531 domain-containing protein, partial [Pseudomonadota bacterium]
MIRPSSRLLVFCFAFSLIPPCTAQDGNEIFSHAAYLNELSDRRRINTLFQNQQTIFDGLQLEYVNVGSGNLTFKRRDLVRLSRLPINIARVYDSRSPGAHDFGVGWRLLYDEQLREDSGGMTYRAASGAELRLVPDGAAAWSVAKGQPSDIRSIIETETAIEMVYGDSWKKVFVDGPQRTFVLAAVIAPQGDRLDIIRDELAMI